MWQAAKVSWVIVMAALLFAQGHQVKGSDVKLSVEKLPGAKGLKERMASFYRRPEGMAGPFEARSAQYPLPLDLSSAVNAEALKRLRLSKRALSMLRANGFVVTDYGRRDDVAEFYKAIENRGLPIFVTSDSLLHLYHIQFDETLKGIEERQFYADAIALSRTLRDRCAELERELDGDTKRAARLCVAHLSVALKLLGDTTPAPRYAAGVVDKEAKLIEAHRGFARSPIFTYDEDYSQYVPRGHYTRSEELKRYFKALMWYGRLTFLIKGGEPPEALVSPQVAKVQTMAASLLASLLGEVRVPDGRTAAQVWDRMYAVTAYYVGLADDLTPYEYRSALREAFGTRYGLREFDVPEKYFTLRKVLAQMRSPEIYGGTGDLAGPPVTIATEQHLLKALETTKGMRLMGQRYVPDSYMMGRLVYPTVGRFLGEEFAFTTVSMPGGPGRGFPRGLDVMAVLGSGRAREHLRALRDDQYERYDKVLAKLKDEFGALGVDDWNRNMYWSWLYALKALIEKPGEGYPTFMQTDAWQDKQLNAALASWAQLRHDTILYAKQSYTMRATAMPPQPKMVEGYVEPVPEFYARLWCLTDMTERGLENMKVLDDTSRQRLQSLKDIIERLLDITRKELRNEALSAQDYAFIRHFGSSLKGAVAGVNREGLETTIVADVHTDAGSGQVLEEGTGYLRLMAVAYPMPDGGVVLGFGPTLSYYEFKHPMADRLTDEKWKSMLRTSPPPPPEWSGTFRAAPSHTGRRMGGIKSRY